MIDKQNTTIVIADDHPLLLKGLFEEFNTSNYNIVDKATNGMDALKLILVHNPTIALLDIDMPLLTGFEVIKMAKEKGVDTKFIVLSFHKEIEYITQAKALQINGYLLKEDSFSEIEKCMEAVIKGKTYFSPSFESNSLESASEEIRKLSYLTPSETTIIKFISKNHSTLEIAEMLFISARTVEKHRSNIINKLGLEAGTNSLTSWAMGNKKVIQEL